MATTTFLAMASSPRKRRRERFPACFAPTQLLLALVAAAFLVPLASATIYVPEFNRSITSLPARFGGQLSKDPNDPPVLAYLTMVPNQPFMCPDELKGIQPPPPLIGASNYTIVNQPNGMDRNNNNNNNNNLMDSNMMIDNNDNDNTNDNNPQLDVPNNKDIYGDIVPLPAPIDGLPVALLVERGLCTFYEKAEMAARYGPSVKYVVIFDNQIAPDLVPMSSETDSDMTLLFVSATSGRELNNWIVRGHVTETGEQLGESADETESEDEDEETNFLGYNLIVEMDGIAPYFEPTYRGLNFAAYMLAAMSGFLAFLIFFGCLLICAQCGCITAAPDEHGRIVLFAGGPGIRHTEGLARMIRVDKLTRDQVLLLEEEEFHLPPSEDGESDSLGEEESPCCAICIDEFEHMEKVRVLPCGHKFHEDCLVPWLTERHASCPLCKMDVLQHVREIEKKNKKSGKSVDDDDDNKEPLEIESSPHDNDSTSTSSSSPRSFWYRLRGWSLVANSAPPETTNTSGITDDISSVASRGAGVDTDLGSSNRSLRVSEIEMEVVTTPRTVSSTGTGTP